MRYFLSIILCLSLMGCAHAPKVVKPFVEPEYGMTKLAMIDLLGTPDSIEIYKKSDLSHMEFYIYHRNYSSSDGSLSEEQEKVPICLINNKVVGWGKSYYEDHVTPDDIRIK